MDYPWFIVSSPLVYKGVKHNLMADWWKKGKTKEIWAPFHTSPEAGVITVVSSQNTIHSPYHHILGSVVTLKWGQGHKTLMNSSKCLNPLSTSEQLIRKCHLLEPSAAYFCLILFHLFDYLYLSIGINGVDTDQTASIWAIWFGSITVHFRWHLLWLVLSGLSAINCVISY